MSNAVLPRATLDDLMSVEGKAELIGGRIVRFMASGHLPSRIASRIFRTLDDYAIQTGVGVAYADGIGFALVPELPNGRESFSPDASWYVGPLPTNEMDFVQGPPTFAVEVRSKNDYGPSAEIEMADKRADYFLAGTLAVWDVDPDNEFVDLYEVGAPTTATRFRRGDTAHAGSAVSGWSVDVNLVLG